MKTILSKSSILKLIILDTLLIFSTTVLYAQEIKVRNIVQLTTDITARSTARMDANNKECAIVRVNIPTIKTMSFGNAVVGDVEYKAGEYIKENIDKILPKKIKEGDIEFVKAVIETEGFLDKESLKKYIKKANTAKQAIIAEILKKKLAEMAP